MWDIRKNYRGKIYNHTYKFLIFLLVGQMPLENGIVLHMVEQKLGIVPLDMTM